MLFLPGVNFACDGYLGGPHVFRDVCLLLMLRIKNHTKRGPFDLQPQTRNLKKMSVSSLSVKEVNGAKIKFTCLCYVNLLKFLVNNRISNIKANKAKKKNTTMMQNSLFSM